jgi:hypothetical protein
MSIYLDIYNEVCKKIIKTCSESLIYQNFYYLKTWKHPQNFGELLILEFIVEYLFVCFKCLYHLRKLICNEIHKSKFILSKKIRPMLVFFLVTHDYYMLATVLDHYREG